MTKASLAAVEAGAASGAAIPTSDPSSPLTGDSSDPDGAVDGTDSPADKYDERDRIRTMSAMLAPEDPNASPLIGSYQHRSAAVSISNFQAPLIGVAGVGVGVGTEGTSAPPAPSPIGRSGLASVDLSMPNKKHSTAAAATSPAKTNAGPAHGGYNALDDAAADSKLMGDPAATPASGPNAQVMKLPPHDHDHDHDHDHGHSHDGHSHAEGNTHSDPAASLPVNFNSNAAIVLMLALSLHSTFEGIALGVQVRTYYYLIGASLIANR